MYERIKAQISINFDIENIIDFIETEDRCYLRFLANSTIYIAEFRKFGHILHIYKIDRSEKA